MKNYGVSDPSLMARLKINSKIKILVSFPAFLLKAKWAK